MILLLEKSKLKYAFQMKKILKKLLKAQKKVLNYGRKSHHLKDQESYQNIKIC